VDEAGAIIGRSEDAEVVLADPAVSRQHARIEVRGGAAMLKDLGSANGAFVNGARVRERTLSHGDVVRIGNSDLRWLLTDGAATDRSMVEQPSLVPPSGSLSASPPPAQDAPSASLWLVAAAGVSAVLVFVVAATALALGALLWWRVAPPDAVPVRAPAWEMRLPPGLPASSTRSLFDHGVARMKAGAYADAVEDFYRVLSVDPGDADARRFAVAASQMLVFEHLAGATRATAADRARSAAERDALLSRRTRAAQRVLVERWGDDPAVVAALGPTPAVEATAAAAEAARLASARGAPDARDQWRTVAEQTHDPAVLRAARDAVVAIDLASATRHHAAWEAAARAEIARDPTAAGLWRALAAEAPADVSARLHARRFAP
jgi:hypothetical protein